MGICTSAMANLPGINQADLPRCKQNSICLSPFSHFLYHLIYCWNRSCNKLGEGVELSSPDDRDNHDHDFSVWHLALWPCVNNALKLMLKINDSTYKLNGKHVLKCFVGLAYSAPLQDGAPTDIPYTNNQDWNTLVSQTRSPAVYSTLQAYLTANEIILTVGVLLQEKADVAELILEVITTKYIETADAEMHRSCKY